MRECGIICDREGMLVGGVKEVWGMKKEGLIGGGKGMVGIGCIEEI